MHSPLYDETEQDEFKRDAINRRIVFVGEMSSRTDKDDLYKIFRRYGQIKYIKKCQKGQKRTERGVPSSQ